MKKILLSLLSLTMCVIFIGCSNKDTASAVSGNIPDTPSTTTLPISSTGESIKTLMESAFTDGKIIVAEYLKDDDINDKSLSVIITVAKMSDSIPQTFIDISENAIISFNLMHSAYTSMAFSVRDSDGSSQAILTLLKNSENDSWLSDLTAMSDKYKNSFESAYEKNEFFTSLDIWKQNEKNLDTIANEQNG